MESNWEKEFDDIARKNNGGFTSTDAPGKKLLHVGQDLMINEEEEKGYSLEYFLPIIGHSIIIATIVIILQTIL